MPRLLSLPGTCVICGKQLKKASAERHLSLCLGATTGSTEYVIVKATSPGLGGVDFWLFAAVPVDANLNHLDRFLRTTWLECCGHLSAFSERRNEIPMSRKICSISEGTKLTHEYDFGSTTELAVTFGARVKGRTLAGRTKVKLLARNDQPEFACDRCGKPAKFVDPEEIFYGGGLFCAECAERDSDLDTDFLLPVVNSPRCGTCAYEG